MFSLDQFPLPYERNALEPYMSEETINYHYGKHLDTYIKNLNSLIVGTDYADQDLQDIIVKSAKDPNATKIFNNSAQVFNHNFFFNIMARDNGSTLPPKIIESFGSQEHFFEQFKANALAVFGSGWTWLVNDNGVLKIINTANADTPIAHGLKPVLTLDVWEHAYYLDHQNRRADFIDVFLNHLVNWAVVEENL